MCGIAGAIGEKLPLCAALVERMLLPIRHRGFRHHEIDGRGECVLGANRLEIVDRENGNQPAWNEDRSVCAVLNGEIYNHAALRQELGRKGHRFKTECDTEVLVHGFEEWGLDLPKVLDGMFAFILFDARSGKLLAARDPFGIKPLYLALDGGSTALASEMKSFSSLRGSSILPLPPGCLLWNNEVVPYFRYPARTREFTFNEARNQLKEVLFRSIAKRLQTDLPVAVFVSGGLDSSFILRVAKELHPNITAISVGITGSPDLAFAKRLCARLGVRHLVKEIDSLELDGLYEKIIFHLESFEPNLVRGAIFTWLMAEVARKHGFRVALAGEGSDELFAGYADFVELTDASQIVKKQHALFRDLHRTQLLRWDKISMAHTVEVRFPFMDRQLVELVWNLPASFNIQRTSRGVITKLLLRAVCEDLLPHEVVNREKVPMDEGACPGGKTQWNEMIASHVARNRGSEPEATLASAFRLRSHEEQHNFLLFREHYSGAGFARGRVQVREK